jgi:hypothetical protein
MGLKGSDGTGTKRGVCNIGVAVMLSSTSVLELGPPLENRSDDMQIS